VIITPGVVIARRREVDQPGELQPDLRESPIAQVGSPPSATKAGMVLAA